MATVLERKLQQVCIALADGDYAAAERLSLAMLDRTPRNPRVLHLYAVARLKQGYSDEARAVLRRILETDRQNSQVMRDLGAAELAAGDAVQSESWLRRALALDKRSAETWSWLGIALASQQRHAEAVDAFHEALNANPDDPGIYLNLGNALKQVGKPEEALINMEKALSLNRVFPEAWNSLGAVLEELGRQAAAIAAFRAAIELNPRYAEPYNNLGNALLTHDIEAAVANFERAIALRPDFFEAHYNLGNAMSEQDKWAAATIPYRRAIALESGHAMAHHNLGNALLEQGRHAEAEEYFENAVALKPDYVKAHCNLAAVRHEQGRYAEAIASCERALTLDAQNADANYNLALTQLFKQQFESAWPLYAYRMHTEGARARLRKDTATLDLFERSPPWRGPRPHSGTETVAVWAEQGIGDQILFSTLIPELIAANVSFIYEVDRRLLRVYERAFPGQRFVALRDPPQETLLRTDYALMSGSLPLLFRKRRADFARQPQRLLQASPGRVDHYRSRLDRLGPGLKVAFSWRSSRADRMGPRKSAPLVQFASLLQLPGVHFVDVQYGDTRAERQDSERATRVHVLHFDEVDYFDDLEDLLAMLEACDLLITTSNVNAHLAGALGKRTWLLYLEDNPPFHYWAHDGGHRSLWYPAVEIVTAPGLATWDALITYTAGKLAQLSPAAGT